ncbi:MAG: guanylate kinase [Spirochaetes bacterium]|nr:guanylate kinase [Spirochaetota bacterium]
MTEDFQKRLFIISGPSGSGKTTLVKKIFKEFPEIQFSISATTRSPRTGEQDGVDYYFLNEKGFKDYLEKDQFAEWAIVHNNYYGTLKSEIKNKTREKKLCILDIDVQGAKSLRQNYPKANYIFVVPPSIEELKNRLKHRETDSSEIIELRVKNAIKELEEKDNYDYVLTNKNLNETYALLKKIVLKQDRSQDVTAT